MPEFDSDSLIARWETGVPLNEAWVEFADSFVLKLLHAKPEMDPLLFGLHNRPYKEAAKTWLPKTAEGRKKKLEIVVQDARACLMRELYAGQWWAIGLRTLINGNDQLVRIPCQVFSSDESEKKAPHPEIHWNKAEICLGDASYWDIHVVRAPTDALHTVRSEDEQSLTTASSTAIPSTAQKRQSRRGRPSNATMIRAAIRDYAKKDPSLRKPRKTRYRAYLAYISIQGIDPDQDSGFSDKTFEKYELEIRNTLK
jgi:hypothetical protein